MAEVLADSRRNPQTYSPQQKLWISVENLKGSDKFIMLHYG
jgi:hypothetical protein